jgi:hypothetical protein
LLTPNPKISVLYLIVSVSLMLSGCGSPKTTGNGESTLESAIAHYIEGDLETAETLFTEVTQQQKSREDLTTAYLYLGRIYMARGDYENAAAAFSSGKLVGGDIRFDEYFELATTRSGVSAAKISLEPTVTRGEIAALIHAMFANALDARAVTNVTPPEGTTIGDEKKDVHWADVYFEALTPTQVMGPLPDGAYHADAQVTRPAFFVVASRLVSRLCLDPRVIEGMYPGGYRSALDGDRGNAALERDEGYVTGREVVDHFERIAVAAGL